ncbi:MAG TPA: reverse transcriptase family protein [Candidatus Ozemobacteraceae bacterium]
MSITGWFAKIFGITSKSERDVRRGPEYDVRELARRLGVDEESLRGIEPAYRQIRVKKPRGGIRLLHEPSPALKGIQRCILHRLLNRLAVHEAAHGFQKGRSIVTHAQPHANHDLVIRADLKSFFPSTRTRRIWEFFTFCGWSNEATELLTKLLTWDNGLPQGAPTSPRLANLVNHAMDARLAALAKARGGQYTRYADDLTFSFNRLNDVKPATFLRAVACIAKEYGYDLHGREKLDVMTYKTRQYVTGLVVNEKVNLPRSVRKWLRAVEHHQKTGRPATLSKEQLNGWKSLQQMIIDQRRIR